MELSRWSLAVGLSLCACTQAPRPTEDDHPSGKTRAALTPDEEHGRDLWLKATFGGERFFTRILPDPPFNLQIGVDEVLTSNRATRFEEYGVLNDPDCTAGDATTGFLDRCPDPTASGIVGIRKFPNPGSDGPRMLVGVACASCHAGLDPENPPADPNQPRWENIHLTVGNQYLDVGKIFRAHLSPHDPRSQVFRTWAPGTVDTTAIESDHVNNPGAITPIFSIPDRPFFDLTRRGQPIRVHRSGQGGEDDVGCELAALRVYFNIGMCAAECMVGHLANGPGGSQTPIDMDECRQACPEFRQAQQEVGARCAFLETARPPKLERAPGGADLIDASVLREGQLAFERACASCHSGGKPLEHEVFSDDEIHPVKDIGTNSCRARTTNWTTGSIWAQFSSDQYKARPTGGPGFYRDMPLLAVWATAPFFHNNRLGTYTGDFTVEGRVAAFEEAIDQLLNPRTRDLRGSVQRTDDWILLPTPCGEVKLPAGVPVALFANVDPAWPSRNLCLDLVENGGHTFGASLSRREKRALTEFLKTL